MLDLVTMPVAKRSRYVVVWENHPERSEILAMLSNQPLYNPHWWDAKKTCDWRGKTNEEILATFEPQKRFWCEEFVSDHGKLNHCMTWHDGAYYVFPVNSYTPFKPSLSVRFNWLVRRIYLRWRRMRFIHA